MTRSSSKQIVEVGDRLRFSMALLKVIADQPEHLSELVELVEVRESDDGGKVLVVKRCEP